MYFGDNDLGHAFVTRLPQLSASIDAIDRMTDFFEESAELYKKDLKKRIEEQNALNEINERIENGLSSIVFGSLLAAAGFNAALKVQPAAVSSMISMLFIWIPVLLLAASFVVFILFFDFERKTDNENGSPSAE